MPHRPYRPRRPSPVPLLPAALVCAALVCAALPSPAAADPGPGVVLALVPPDSQGGPTQISGQLGTPHTYQTTGRPLILGFHVDDRIAPWMFVTLAVEANPAPGEDTFFGANAIGPTFLAGKPDTVGPLVVLAPRVGFDGHSYDAWAFHLGGHVLLDAPLAWDGALRFFVGPSYALLDEFDGRGKNDLRGTRHYALAVAGVTAHLAARFDLSATVTVPLFVVDLGDPSLSGYHQLEPTGSLQFTLQAGPLPERRAVIPAPGDTGRTEDDEAPHRLEWNVY